ncbi:MAG TPA: hypothetical protein VF630_04920 [Hymenobacter sp.]
MTDATFIVAAILLSGEPKPFVHKNISILIMDVIYTIVVLGMVPLLCALSLGGFGNRAFSRMKEGSAGFNTYALILLLLLLNTYFTNLFLSHDFSIFGNYVGLKYVHFILVALLTLFVYRYQIFNNTSCTLFANK